MGKDSAISWTTHSWNPWRGCWPVSAGCKYCYMERWAKRWGLDPRQVTRTTRATWRNARKWDAEARDRMEPGKPARRPIVFTCSLSDFLHPAADEWRAEALDVIRECSHLFWVICGGETGKKGEWRRFDTDWARQLRDECAEADVPFHFKGGNGGRPAKSPPELDGVVHDALPWAVGEKGAG